jgi:hypothetical protein
MLYKEIIFIILILVIIIFIIINCQNLQISNIQTDPQNNVLDETDVVSSYFNKLPIPILKTIEEIGNSMPNEQQLARLEKEIREAVPNITELLNEIKNAPKDSEGMPEVSKNKLQLVMLMISIFMLSKTKYFKDEIGQYIAQLKLKTKN